MVDTIINSARARVVAVALGVGVIGALAAAPPTAAAGLAPKVPLVGAGCQLDGHINGAGADFQAGGVNDAFTYGYQEDVCGRTGGPEPNLNSAYSAVNADPSQFTFGTASTSVQGMTAYNYDLSGIAAAADSGSALLRMSCRTDFFAGTDLPYDNSQLAAVDGIPGSDGACSALNTGAVPAPFGPQTTVGYPNTGDAAANVMTVPVAAGAVAYAANLSGACPLPIPTGVDITANEFNSMWQGTITAWNDPALTATNPGPVPSVNTTANVGQALPGVTATAGGDVLPTTTLAVTSTTGFPASGTLELTSSTGTQTVAYAGTTATSFTGVTGGTGNVAGAEGVYGVGALTVNPTAAFPTSGDLTVAGTHGTEVLTYTGTTTNGVDTVSFTGVTATSHDTVSSGAAVITTSPLAACSLAPMQRVVRSDDSGETAITMFTLYGIEQLNSGASLCGTPTGTTWYSIATSSTNAGQWPQCGLNPVSASGAPALIALLKTTDGGIGYAQIGAWGPLPSGVSFLNLQTYADEQTPGNGLSNNDPGPDSNGNRAFAGPGSPGRPPNCSLPLTPPTGTQPAQGVGLGTVTWSDSGTSNGGTVTPGDQDVAWSTQGAGYPACGLTFDMVYAGVDDETGELGGSGGTPGCTSSPTNTTNGAQTLPALPYHNLILNSIAGFPISGVVEVTSSAGDQYLSYTFTNGSTTVYGTPSSGPGSGTGTVPSGTTVSLITGSCQSVQGPLQGSTNDQLRTLYAYFTYALSPLGQSYLPAQSLLPLPAPWLPELTAGFQENF